MIMMEEYTFWLDEQKLSEESIFFYKILIVVKAVIICGVSGTFWKLCKEFHICESSSLAITGCQLGVKEKSLCSC